MSCPTNGCKCDETHEMLLELWNRFGRECRSCYGNGERAVDEEWGRSGTTRKFVKCESCHGTGKVIV